MTTTVKRSKDLRVVSWSRRLREEMAELGIETFEQLTNRLSEAWKDPAKANRYFNKAAGRLIAARTDSPAVTCRHCGALQILYPRYGLKVCSECDSKAVQISQKSILFKAFPELVAL